MPLGARTRKRGMDPGGEGAGGGRVTGESPGGLTILLGGSVASWQRAPGGFRRKLLSGTTGNRINVEGDSAGPPAPDYIRLETIIGRNSIAPPRSRA